MVRVFLGVGSNEGDRLANVSRAIQELAGTPGVSLLQMATIIETEALGGPPQGPYLNTVVEVETGRAPRDLLDLLKLMEQRLGRTSSDERWGPRPIDLDILLYGNRIVHEPGLIIPHERLHERRFVLEPLAQLAPEVVHPVLKQTTTDLLARLSEPSLA